MALKINFNAEATVTHTALLQNERAMNKSLLRISTGNRILSAADDAAGLFIANQLSVFAAALEQGNRNIQTGISALQIAETNVGQIFDKLKTIYTKAQSAANDINDPNARSSLQRDIANLVDAIQKLATDTEYNGIKLLDGTFASKVIHYGARADQTITVGINSVKANDLGAFMVTGSYSTTQATASASGSTVANGYTASTGAVATGGAFRWDSGDRAVVAGIDVSTGLSFAVDAKKIADNINSSTNLQNAGISARASNTSKAAAEWTDIQVGTGQSLTIRFFVGSDSSADITISVGAGQVLTLSDLVTQINRQASQDNINITAKSDNNRLVLTTQGETIGLEVSASAAATTGGTSIISVDMAQFLGLSSTGQNVSATANSTGAATATGSAIQVGKLVIMGTDNTAGITISVGAGQVLTLSDLVTQINRQASQNNKNITAKADNNRLVLTTQGETIGLEVSASAAANAGSISVNMAQFLGLSDTGPQNVSATATNTAAASATGSAIQVGKLVIMGTDKYNYDFTGITSQGAGLGINPATGDAAFKNLYSLDVTNNLNAEIALDIVKTAIQRVDKIRTQIGSVINNLQAIWDGQKASYDNTKEAENVIRNTDFAAEMSTFITMQIRMQSGIAMLAQANALPQLVLQLLR